MTKDIFFAELEKNLKNLPLEEKNDALMYYGEYFADSPKPEEEIIKELGNPSYIARQITAQSKVNETEILEPSAKKSMSAIGAVILAIFAIPIGVPLLIGVAAIAFGLLVSIFAIILSLFITGAAMVIAAVVMVACSVVIFFVHLPTGIAMLGASLACFGIGILILVAIFYFNKFFVGALLTLARKISGGKKK